MPPTALGGICPECMLKAGLATQTEGPGATGPHGTRVVPPLPKPEEIAPLFPQLEILECLGRGGMGVVYKARQPRLNRLVALKILAREKEQDAQFAERFTREAQALARLNHPNIVTVHDFGEIGGHCYLVMEFVDGLNLRQLLQAGKMPPEQALAIVPKICEALQYAHEQGIVHRDIKPENILLDKSGRVKIADFGIAKMLGGRDALPRVQADQQVGPTRLTKEGHTIGTPHYMAPEQIEKPLTVDHRADIYSLGVVFYEMLTGELPLGKFQPPSKKVHVDVRLDEVVLHALEKEPERRYQQASDVKTAVETIAVRPESSRSRQSTPAAIAFRRGTWAGLSIFALIVVVAAIITFLLPKTYVGDARVKVISPPPLQDYNPYLVHNEIVFIRSTVLPEAANALDLAERWGKRYANGSTLTREQTYDLMERGLDIKPIKDTILVDVRYYSESPTEAAEIANKIAEVYCTYPPGHRGDIVRLAEPPSRPARPNVPLNIFLGIVGGGVIGIFAGIMTGVIAFWRLQASRFEIKTPADTSRPQDANLTCNRPARFGHAWKLAAFIFVLILCYELSSTVFSHLFANRSRATKSDSTSQALLQSKVKYASKQASVQDIVRNLAEQAGLKYDWQKSFAQTDPLCRQWVRNVTIEDETCQQALDQILKPVGLRYQVENGALVLSRQDEGATKSDYIGQADFPYGDSIEITSVERTPERMVVKGRYNLVSHDRAELALYITTKTNIAVPTDSTQTKEISKGAGEFELIHSHLVPGWPHVSMYADGGSFAALYFGTKEEAAEESKLPNGWSLATGKENAAKLAKLGWQLWQSGKLAQAEEKFQQAVRLAPDDANAWNGLGWAEFNSGNSQDAEQAFQKAVSLDPNQPGALNGLGQIYLSQRKYDQAESYLLKAAPQAPAAWYGLTRLYLLEGKYDQAEKWAQDLIDAGQADDLVRQMLKAAQEKHLSEGLKFRIEPPAISTSSINPTMDTNTVSALQFRRQTTPNTIDCVTGLPIASSGAAAIDPATGLPIPSGGNGTIDSTTGLPTVPPTVESTTNAVAIAEKWLALIDTGNYSESWSNASAIFRGGVTEPAWENSMNTFRKPLGALISRKLQSAQSMTEMPGAPDGQYVLMQFQSSFASKKSAIETVTFMREKDGQWRSAGYFIK